MRGETKEGEWLPTPSEAARMGAQMARGLSSRLLACNGNDQVAYGKVATTCDAALLLLPILSSCPSKLTAVIMDSTYSIEIWYVLPSLCPLVCFGMNSDVITGNVLE